jgi:hypothetical protein
VKAAKIKNVCTKKTNQNKQKASTKKSKKTNERKNPGSRGKGTGIFSGNL